MASDENDVCVHLTAKQAEALLDALAGMSEEALYTLAMAEAEAQLLRALGREVDEGLQRTIADGPTRRERVDEALRAARAAGLTGQQAHDRVFHGR